MLIAFAAAASPVVLAFDAPVNVPDGGATALLVAMGAAGLVAANKGLRKK